ncbi:uncharacterized protein LOC9660457 isoform X1 [Selaginella moellendorffii]|uniref:uncharacterized protein LOC9660457 isoform X1 n=1 Tax=Selaginella moellendorffii TaxID=88036 RepID=UPI000D1CBD34|nr:uncharacterized protein LOC9660457 isoform X1 [Selaginella moellendorffii]XP_024525628.1 uncharacterized protein LOC9660457 isoform X1 [Selaginella moellendorffii]XP_024525629.1 uncharacterized protein LOC9660457 isoform X1 [Selaginella moellendorffii]XP_024525630.1 uncharacterized protein LOC9660457 isoform X1 [Selaginella moellendorffii]|eukprot:XP_024525627.1 uncharacterized protein LOC9660457 isoform X1 [Selaginella moellendorffii]
MRPQRQARSRISYAESVSDDDDEDFSALPVRTSARRRPERESRSSAAAAAAAAHKKKKARPNPKERAEAMQLERAIRESLNDVAVASEISTASFVSSSPTNPSIAFQCLLDVTYEEGRSRAFELQESGEAADAGDRSKQYEPSGAGNLTKQPQPADVDDLAKVQEPTMEEDMVHEEDRATHQEVEDMPDSTKRRGEKEEQGNGTNASRHASPKRIKKRRMNEGEDVSASFGVGETAKVKKPECSSATPDELLPPVQSSTTLSQRRVVGLSRRFRPPSLHPYLNS